MFDDYEDILTVDQLMEMLGIGRNKAYELLNDGSIKSVRIGNRHRVPKASVIHYIVKKCRGSYIGSEEE